MLGDLAQAKKRRIKTMHKRINPFIFSCAFSGFCHKSSQVGSEELAYEIQELKDRAEELQDEAEEFRYKASELRDQGREDKAMELEHKAMELEAQAHDLIFKAEELLWESQLEGLKKHEVEEFEHP